MKHLKQVSEIPVETPEKMKTIANICNIHMKRFQTSYETPKNT
jgi:hypothetical protein